MQHPNDRAFQAQDPTPLSFRKRIVGTIVLWIVLGCMVWAGITLMRLSTALSRTQNDLAALESLAQQDPGRISPEQAIALLEVTRSDLHSLRSAAQPFLWLAPHLGWLPRYGPEVQAAPVLLNAVIDVADAGSRILSPLAPLLEDSQAGPDRDELRTRTLVTLQAAQPDLQRALVSVEKAQEAGQELSTRTHSPALKWIVRWNRYAPALKAGLQAALLLPDLLGAEAPQTYLLLVQNEDELRATGGFISGVARLTIHQANVQELHFEDSYAIADYSQPYPAPPEPLSEFMMSEIWLFRDSNWDPDLSTTARTAISLYEISHPANIHGVIAVDQQAIRLLVDALAPLQVEGQPEPLTGENVIQVARQAWAPGTEVDGSWWQHRKDVMALVLDAAVERLQNNLDGATIVGIMRAARQAGAEKHLMLYLDDERAAELLAELGWDGAVRPSETDYVLVVDSNIGFNKVNALVQQEIAYTIDLNQIDRPQATLTIRYTHPSPRQETNCRHEPRYDATYEQMMERCYWDYIRVYVPPGAQLVDATPYSISGQELLSGKPNPAQVIVGPPQHGHQVLATLLLVRPGETREMRFVYSLPQDILQIHKDRIAYTLVIPKQPGTRAIPVQARVLLPPRTGILTSAPEPTLVTERELRYELGLKTDQTIQLTLHR
jgi:hypothetical protein